MQYAEYINRNCPCNARLTLLSLNTLCLHCPLSTLQLSSLKLQLPGLFHQPCLLCLGCIGLLILTLSNCTFFCVQSGHISSVLLLICIKTTLIVKHKIAALLVCITLGFC